MSIEAMKQALEALELALRCHGVMLLSDPPQDAWKYHGVEADANKAITTLRTAIAEAEKQEPVAWMNKHGACKTSLFREIEAGAKDEYTIPLYTTPPAVEREACARLCDEIAANYNNPTALECAAAIRARG